MFDFLALTSIGNMIQKTADYCYNRKAFGKPLLDNQVIHFRLGELETELEALRSLTYRAIGNRLCTKTVHFLYMAEE